MTNEEINNTNDYELIMLYHEDDEDAKNIIFYKYSFIIDIIIKKYKKYISALNIDNQEIYSECTVGFSDGLKNYDPEKDASLPTFITLCVERRIGNVIRKYSSDKYKQFIGTYSLDFIYDNSDSNMLEFISDEGKLDPLKNITEEEEYRELLEKIKKSLTKKEYEVFILEVRGLNYIEIAKILNKTPKQIDNTIQRIKTKVRNIIYVKS